VIIITVILVHAQSQIDTNNLNEEEKLAYNLGSKNFNQLGNKPSDVQASFLDTPQKVEAFLAGLEQSKQKDEFYDLWALEINGKLGDDAKEHIWKFLEKDITKASEHSFEIARRILKKKYGDINWNDEIERGLEKFILENPEQLTWKGNKLIKKDTSDVLIDLENLPNWIKEIKYKDGQFTYTVNTGSGNWDLSFNKGTVDALLRRVDSKGRPIGIHTDEGIISIKFNKEEGSKIVHDIEIKHYIKDKSDEDNPPIIKTVKFNRETTNQRVFERLEQLLDSQLGEIDSDEKRGKISEFLAKYETSIAINFLDDNTKNKLGINIENMLSFARNNPEGSSIFITEDAKGNTIINPSGGASFNSFTSNFEVSNVYESSNTNKESTFTFNSVGVLHEATNFRLGPENCAKAESEGTFRFQITRNTLANAINSQDPRAALEYLLLGNPNIIGRLGADKNGVNELSDIAKIIEAELGNPELGLEATGNLQEIGKEYSQIIADSATFIVDDIFDKGKEILPDTEYNREIVTNLIQSNLEKGLLELYTNSEQLPILLGDASQRDNANSLIRKLVENRLDNKDVTSLLNSINNRIPEQGQDTFLKDGSIKATIKDVLSKVDFHGLVFAPGKSEQLRDEYRSRVIAQLTLSDGATPKEIDSRAKSIREFVDDISTKIRVAESDSLRERISERVFSSLKKEEYKGPLIVLDTNSRAIGVRGDDVDLTVLTNNLRKLSVNPDSKDVNLFNQKGRHIATFTDGDIYSDRKRISNIPQSERLKIADIRTSDDEDARIFALNNKFGNYELYDTQRRVSSHMQKVDSRSKIVDGIAKKIGSLGADAVSIGAGFITTVSLGLLDASSKVSYLRNMPITVEYNEADIYVDAPRGDYLRADDTESKLTITANVYPFGFSPYSRRAEIAEGFKEEFRKSPEGRIGAPLRELANEVSQKLTEADGISKESLKQAQDLFNFAEDNGITIPLKQKDRIHIAGNQHEINAIIDFISRSRLRLNNNIEFGTTYIKLNGNFQSSRGGYQSGTHIIGTYHGRQYSHNGIVPDPANFRQILNGLSNQREKLAK
jgi:hypothetical protein